jgi:hypothetical protein
MAICNALTAAVSKSCDSNIGGIKQMFINDWQELTLTLDGNGMITNFTPTDPNSIVTTAATVNTTTSGFVRILTTVTLTGDQTSKLTAGTWFYFTYNVMQIDGVTVTATFWSGEVFSSSYNAGTNTTTVTPDFDGFTPLVGQSADPAPPNTNQTVSTYAFFEFAFNKNTSNLEETSVVELANSNTVYTQVANLILNRRDKIKREAIIKLYSGLKKLNIVIVDNNNKVWLLGDEFGSFLTSLAGGTGTVLTDRNSYDLSFTSESSTPAREMDYALLAGSYFIEA